MKLAPRGLLALALLVLLGAASACREGEGVIVRHLAFEGVAAVSEAELRLAVTTTGSSALPWSQKTYFSKQDFNEDLKRLEAFYASHGFPDARVSSFRTVYNSTKTEMDLTVVIAEGQPVVIEALEFTGFDVLPESHLADLKSKIALEPGQPRDQERVEVARGMALDELRDHGYPAATVSRAERPGSAPRSVIVSLAATPGTFARFGDVIVRGNKTVGANVVLRQMAFKKGDAFSRAAVQTSQRRLYNIELFQFANIEVVDVPTTPGEVGVTITVVEAPHRETTFGAGYGSEEHLRAQANWRHLNFLGGGRTAEIETRFSSLDRGVRGSFTEPAILPGLSLGLGGQSWYADTPAYTLRSNGGRVSVLRQLSSADPGAGSRARNSVAVAFSKEYENYRVSEEALNDASFRPTLISLGMNPETGEGVGTVVALSIDLARNTVDNLLDARRGSLLSVHSENAARVLGGDFDYHEITSELRGYVSFSPVWSVAARARAGSIGTGQDPETSVPFFKRYFLGGSSSLRGWGRFEVAPLTGEGLPIGGYSMFESSGELRLTPGGTSALGLVGFLDIGNVWDRSWRIYLNDLRADIGAGVRYRTPVGPLRFDFAYQLTPNHALVIDGGAPGAYRQWRIHFSLGQAF